MWERNTWTDPCKTVWGVQKKGSTLKRLGTHGKGIQSHLEVRVREGMKWRENQKRLSGRANTQINT